MVLIKENEELKAQAAEGRKKDAAFLESTLRMRINILEKELVSCKQPEIPSEMRNSLKEFQLNVVRKLETERAALIAKVESLNGEMAAFQEYMHGSLLKSKQEIERLNKEAAHWRSIAEGPSYH